jgi:hypothetical protein
VAFVRAREQLARLGVNYPPDSTDQAAMAGKVMSGNGMGILEAVAPRVHDPAEAERSRANIVEQALGFDGHTTLYSSEFLFSFAPKSVVTLRDELDRRGVRLEFVVYVRNIAGHAASSYAQAVKRRMYTGSFREYIDRDANGPYRMAVRRKLQSLLDRVGSDNLHVLHYDSVRSRLVPDFCSHVLGVDVDQLELTDVPERVNRSLTGDEIAIVRYMNRSLVGRKRAHLVGDLIIDHPPFGSPGLSIDQADFDLLRHYYEADMEWLNETFFPDNRQVAVAADDVRLSDRADPVAELSERERFVLDLAAQLANRSTSD